MSQSNNIEIVKAFKELLELNRWRYKVYYGGRGGAKSHNFGRALCVLGAQKPMRILCARELQGSIQDSVHKLLSDIITNNAALNAFYNVQKSTIIGKNGTEFIFKGLKHNATEIKSTEGIDVAWVEEAEKVSDLSWEVLIPTIRKDESEIWVSFNTKNITDPTYERFVKGADNTMLVKKVSWRDNPFFPGVLDHERKRLKESDPEAYLHIWEGEPDTRRSGAIYAKQIIKAHEEGRITRVPYDPSTEVFTAWDLGYGDATSIWWLQWVGRELRWLEYYENCGEQLQHYVSIVKSKNYNYSTHYLPHDAAHGNIRGLAIDTQLTDLGIKNTVLDSKSGAPQSIDAGIELLRQTLALSVFDQEKCKQGIKSLEVYGYEWNEKTNTFKKNPLHDWSSHAADAARYAGIAASFEKSSLQKVINDPFKDAYAYNGGSWMGA